jgi:hypothetical protein
MRPFRSTLLTGALLAGLATDGEAQHPQVRKGFWIGFGLGYGSADVSCDGCASTSRGTGLSTYLKLGGTLSSKVLLGGEIDGMTTTSSLGLPSVGSVDILVGSMTGTVTYYPAVKSGFFVKGGAGFSLFNQTDAVNTLDGMGWGLLAGIGYDLRVGRNVSLTPVANFYFGGPGNITSGSATVATGTSQNVIDIGLGITFH